MSFECVKVWTEDAYDTFMVNKDLTPKEISMSVYLALKFFLKRHNCFTQEELEVFIPEIQERTKELLETNNKVKKELKKLLGRTPEDLNSAVMGIPNTKDSDLDMMIPVKSEDEQKKIGELLKKAGYSFDGAKQENVPSKIAWHTYKKEVDGIEIEVKVRSKKVLDDILVAHRGIRDHFNPGEKILISYMKTLLVRDKEPYKKFKYMLYAAGFKGYKRAIIFRV